MRVNPDDVDVLPRWGACPRCGDSLQDVPATLPDHGSQVHVHLAWCMDCLRVRGEYVRDLGQRYQAED